MAIFLVSDTVTVKFGGTIMLNNRDNHPGDVFILHIQMDHGVDAAPVITNHNVSAFLYRHFHLR
ncbi:hypothetical protein D3C85_1765600 [compost metagenome]